jgi:transcription initiation factor TFIIE subunit alpha
VASGKKALVYLEIERFKSVITRNGYWGIYVAIRFTSKKIEEVISRILHDDGLDLLKVLKGKENVSEFDIAKKMKRDIKVVRRMLYLLYNNNLVTFTRKKDKQKGWYIYYWTIDVSRVKFNYIKEKKELLLRLKETLEREQKELFFVSPDGGVRLNFDDAMEFDFHCPETGELMQQDDNSQRIIELQKKIKDATLEIEEWEIAEKQRIKLASKKVEDELKKEEALERKRIADEKKKKELEKQRKLDEKKKKAEAKKLANAKKRAEAKKKIMAKKKIAKIAKKKDVKSKKASKKKVAKKRAGKGNKVAKKRVEARKKTDRKKKTTKKKVAVGKKVIKRKTTKKIAKKRKTKVKKRLEKKRSLKKKQ